MTTLSDRPEVRCRDFIIDLLLDYLEETLGPDDRTACERHLDDCDACRAYLATYSRTREVVGSTMAEPMPDEMKARLRRFLVEKLSRNGDDKP
jgi:anti-sigma factor RsiW